MASLVKDLRISNLTSNNFVITAVVLAVIIALFFIPELLELQKNLFSSSSQTVKKEKVEPLKSEKQKLALKVESSPLNRILELLDSGYLDQLKEKRMRGESIVDDLEQALNTELPLPQGPKASLGSAEEIQPRFVSGEQVTWKTLRASSSLKTFKDARKRALEIAAALDPAYSSAKFALYNFVNGLNKIIEGAEKSMKPEEAMAYLEHLDQDVTDSFLKDRWADVSLGALFEQSRSQRMKTRSVPAFNPGLTLTYVRVKQPSDRFGRFNPTRPALVYVEGFVRGKDAKRMVLLRNGEQVRRISLRKKMDTQGRRIFNIPQRDATGVYTIVAYDKEGSRYARSFSFYDRARQFNWIREQGGTFALPFAESDPRLTSFFMVAGQGRSRSMGNLESSASGENFPMTQF